MRAYVGIALVAVAGFWTWGWRRQRLWLIAEYADGADVNAERTDVDAGRD